MTKSPDTARSRLRPISQSTKSTQSCELTPREPRMLRLVLIALLAIFATPIKAETWPTRPLTMVVPFATGGPMDAVARILQSALSDALQQQVIIENIGEAGGMLGTARVAKSAPDGYQFVLGNVRTAA